MRYCLHMAWKVEIERPNERPIVGNLNHAATYLPDGRKRSENSTWCVSIKCSVIQGGVSQSIFWGFVGCASKRSGAQILVSRQCNGGRGFPLARGTILKRGLRFQHESNTEYAGWLPILFGHLPGIPKRDGVARCSTSGADLCDSRQNLVDALIRPSCSTHYNFPNAFMVFLKLI